MLKHAEEIKRLADILKVAEALGIENATYNKNICCPFHDDRTPSFRFNPPRSGDGGTYKCFSECDGSQGGNDVFALVMNHRGCDFREAMKFVAQLVGYHIQAPERQDDPLYLYRKSLGLAQTIYRSDFSGSPAERYLLQRGFTSATLEEFEPGHAKTASLSIRAKKYMDQLEDLGLIRRDDANKPYDLLRNRFTLPIHNHDGRLVGFGARDISGSQQAKYMNSPDSRLFNKSAVLFGYHRYAKHSDRVIITEGYLDVMALYQVGFRDAVCSMGVAVSSACLQQLSQDHAEIVFLFDGDAAGLQAARRAAKTAISLTDQPVSFRFCFLPAGSDPCDIAMEYGSLGIQYYLDQGLFLSEFLIEEVRRAHEKPAIEERVQELSQLSDLVSLAPSGLFRDLITLEINRFCSTVTQHLPAVDIRGSTATLELACKLLEETYGSSISTLR